MNCRLQIRCDEVGVEVSASGNWGGTGCGPCDGERRANAALHKRWAAFVRREVSVVSDRLCAAQANASFVIRLSGNCFQGSFESVFVLLNLVVVWQDGYGMIAG